MRLLKSVPGELQLLWGTSSATGVKTLHGRSFDGKDWDAAKLIAPLLWSCDADACEAELPTSSASAGMGMGMEDGAEPDQLTYSIEVITAGPAANETLAARFLQQATFGSTRADIAHALKLPAAEWIEEQMKLPATLHRTWYRHRSNQLVLTATPPGNVRSPCEADHPSRTRVVFR